MGQAAVAASARQREGARSPAAAGIGADAAGGLDWGLVRSATTTVEETSRRLFATHAAQTP